MTEHVTRRLLQRRYTDLVERLSIDYTDVSLDTVIRVVRTASPSGRDVDVRDVDDTTTAVEQTARRNLATIAAAAHRA